MDTSVRTEAELAARIVADAGGLIVGRTKVQKIAYLLEVMGFGEGFEFEYKHYGPYSERLSSALKYGELYDLLTEDVKVANWGGRYSVFSADAGLASNDEERKRVIVLGKESDPVDLELAATAVLLAKEGFVDPWKETAARKPDKAAGGRLDRAQALLKQFKALDAKGGLPAIA